MKMLPQNRTSPGRNPSHRRGFHNCTEVRPILTNICYLAAITQKTDTMLLLIPYGLQDWFIACVHAQWDGVQIADLVLRLEKEKQMKREDIDRVIMTDYEKLENSAKREIAKHRPAIKEIIIAAQNGLPDKKRNSA